MLEVKAFAKINWRLAVTGRRADGYHQLHGLMQSISLYDDVCLSLSDIDECYLEPALDIKPEQNLALRAWLLLKKRLGLQQCLKIEITKRIPTGGGLAGGSSNAAAVLNGANQLLNLGLSLPQLQKLGLELGADIPFCLQGGLALAAGVGDELKLLSPPKPLWLLLAFAGQTVPTERIFQQYRASDQAFTPLPQAELETEQMLQALAGGDLAGIQKGFRNDLQPAAQALYPNLFTLEQIMRDQGLKPTMTGSGGVFFALCESEQQALAAQNKLADKIVWIAVVSTIAPCSK